MGPVLHQIAGIRFSPHRRPMAGAKRKGSICLRTSMTQGEIRLVMGKTVSIILHFSENFY